MQRGVVLMITPRCLSEVLCRESLEYVGWEWFIHSAGVHLQLLYVEAAYWVAVNTLLAQAELGRQS